MRLAVVSSTPLDPREGSGTFVGIAGLARGLVELGHQVSFRPLGRRTGFHTLDRWLYNAGLVLRPPRGADVVLGLDLDGFLWARRRQLPFVVALKGIIADELRNERGWVRRLLAVQARWERLNTARADLVMVTSRYCAGVAQRAYGVPAERLVVVPEPVDLEVWDDQLGRARARDRRPAGGGPVVLCVARMYPRKRIGDLLRAAPLVRAAVPGARFRVVGRGPDWEEVRALHAHLGLAGAVDLLGDVTLAELAAEYAGADAFCLPSVQEGFGIVFLEAMVAGLPVVACRAAAIPEVVLDGATGVLVPPRDPDALAAALVALLRDPERARTLGREGRRRAEAFTPRRIAEQCMDAIRLTAGRLHPREA